MRPGLLGIERRLDRIEARLTDRGDDDHADELRFWRWLIRTDEGRAYLKGPFEQVFGRWQRDRLRELGRRLDLDGDAGLDAWCARTSAVEIGAGPYPALAAAPRWRRAVAVDPLARRYADEGLLTPAAAHVVYVQAPGERVPLPGGFADLVVIENALDHVRDPEAVVAEIDRLLVPGGLLWLLVDLSEHRDEMHPHPFNQARVRSILSRFDVLSEHVSDHHSHPKAYGEYRGLLRKPAEGHGTRADVHVRAGAAEKFMAR